MRIISKYQDYYDSVMNTGMDREVIYVREQVETQIDKIDLDFLDSYSSSNHSVNMILLGYCGAFYKIYVVTTELHKIRYVFHNYEDFKSFMLTNGFGSGYDFSENRWWPNRFQKFRDYNPKPLEKIFHEQQTPLFIVKILREYRKPTKYLAILGPCLKDLEFYKIKDAYTAYQDIFQYVSGVLNRPDAKMVNISDKDKIHKHGFDKWSFRQKGPKK